MKLSNSYRILTVILALPILFLVFGLYQERNHTEPISTVTSTSTNKNITSISIKDITFLYSIEQFGLATTQEQILVKSYIPPCSESFDYCLYYIGDTYKGTNFESAGLRIQERNDLKNEKLCLETAPDGYGSRISPNSTSLKGSYSTSLFSDIGDAGAGHYATGDLYRLFIRKSGTCYEFETRIGQSQFANYPSGTIKEFTEANATIVMNTLLEVMNRITFDSIEIRFK